nr:hypothetical protein [Entomoplasma sp. MP1]
MPKTDENIKDEDCIFISELKRRYGFTNIRICFQWEKVKNIMYKQKWFERQLNKLGQFLIKILYHNLKKLILIFEQHLKELYFWLLLK